MFIRQLFTLALAAMVGSTPINFISTENPLTRVDSAYWRTSYRIDDLGAVAAAGTDNHIYTINYPV